MKETGIRRGIILAGGTGTRLHPVTQAVSKQLLPVYDKPMIYYPITTLMLAGITELLVITTPVDRSSFERLLGDGSQWGITIKFATQAAPNGIAEAFLIGEDFLAGRPAALILGDNLFYGSGLGALLRSVTAELSMAHVFAQRVSDPERYGVISFNQDNVPASIEEKPQHPASNWAVTGLYFYPSDVVEIVRKIRPSARGELEITAVNESYLADGRLLASRLDRGFAWLDTGTFNSLVEASEFVRVIEQRQMVRIGSPEEVAYHMGYISADQLRALAEPLLKSGYGEYLMDLANRAHHN